MVAGDVTGDNIKNIYRKAEKCQSKNCYNLIYSDVETLKHVAPPLFKEIKPFKNDKIEL